MTNEIEYLHEQYAKKCEVWGFEMQEEMKVFEAMGFSFQECRRKAYASTKYLREILLEMPSVQEYINKLRGPTS